MREERMTFGALAIGDTFIFASEREPSVSGLAFGPWRKISARKYVRIGEESLTCRVGTTHVAVIRLTLLEK